MFKIAVAQQEDGTFILDLIMRLPEQFRKQHKEFFDLYEIVDMQPNEIQSATLMPAGKRTCRFCEKSYPEVHFKKKAHIIPELMGRSQLLSDFECDNCNQLFSKYETELAYFIGAARSLTHKKAKGGIPTYKTTDKKLVIRTVPNDTGDEVITLESTDFENKIKIDEENRKITIQTDRATYVPLKVFKSLVKILLTLLPEDSFIKYKLLTLAVIDIGDEKKMLTGNPLCRTMIYVNPGIPFPSPLAIVMQKKELSAAVPSHSLVLYFQNYIYQIFLPFYKDDMWLYDGKQNITIHTAPPLVDEAFVNQFGAPEFYNVNLSANTPVKKQKSEIVMSFTAIKKTDTELDNGL